MFSYEHIRMIKGRKSSSLNENERIYDNHWIFSKLLRGIVILH